MNMTSGASDRGGGAELNLPGCPICHEPSPPSRQRASIGGADYVWYECGACHSALLSLGDGRWAYQKITRSGHERLLRTPLTLPELRRLLPGLAPRPAAAPALPERTPPRAEPAWPAPGPVVPVARESLPEKAPPKAQAAAASESLGSFQARSEATSIEALRANLRVEEERPGPLAPEADGEGAVSRLPFPFIVAAVILVVLLIAGVALVVLLGLRPG